MTQPFLTSARSPRDLRRTFARHIGLVVPVCLICAVLVVIAPLSPVLLDLLLAANITLAVIILLTTTQVDNPLQFSVFPSLLLGSTLVRLVLNIATTRLILTRAADTGTAAAGGVIAAFGEFVTSGSLVVGLVLFLILVAVQFLVITGGATRISEVAARFALDGMPGRQMAIDADLAAGTIDATQAQQQRRQLVQQADFYGAMDGASKFIRGDAIAGLVITLINICGGLAIGVLQHGMTASDAASVFTTLTIGDGLVSQLPAFLIAIAAGLLMTRTSVDSNLSREAVGQTFAYPVVLYSAAVMLALLAFTGLPMVPMLCLAVACALVAYSVEPGAASADPPMGIELTSSANNDRAQPTATHFLPGEPEPLSLELGLGLLSMARQSGQGSLIERIGQLRHRLAAELGFVIPKSRIRDNLLLGFYEFSLTLDGLSITNGTVDDIESGVDLVAEQVEQALRRNSHTLLSRQQVHRLLEHQRTVSPQLVEEVVPGLLKIGDVHQVLKSLLREQVPIVNLEAILATLADTAHQTRDISALTNAVREHLGRSICSRHCRPDGTLPAIMLDPMFEASLAEGFCGSQLDALTQEVRGICQRPVLPAERPVVICRSDVRSLLHERLALSSIELPVVSRNEVPPDVRIEVIAEVGQSLLLNASSVAA